MPIQISTPTPFGVNATYHVLKNITLYPIEQQINVTVQSYATSNTAMEPILSRSYSFAYSDLRGGMTDPTQGEIYAYLLTLPDYGGGTII